MYLNVFAVMNRIAAETDSHFCFRLLDVSKMSFFCDVFVSGATAAIAMLPLQTPSLN